MPLVAPRSMKPTVSTPPASRSHQRARPPRASGIRPATASSAPVRMHLRIRLVRVNRGAPNLSAEPADWLHTTRFRRCDRSLLQPQAPPYVSSRVRLCALQERGWLRAAHVPIRQERQAR
jgi:hypothetical protein